MSPELKESSLVENVRAAIATDDKTKRPAWDIYFGAVALLISARSPCERLRVGCVLVSSGDTPNRIISSGYNGFAPGAPHTSRIVNDHEQATIHAEQNAIADAAKRGVSTQKATAYVTHYPCVNCAKILIAAGVKTIRYIDDYKNDPIATDIMKDSGIVPIKL